MGSGRWVTPRRGEQAGPEARAGAHCSYAIAFTLKTAHQEALFPELYERHSDG